MQINCPLYLLGGTTPAEQHIQQHLLQQQTQEQSSKLNEAHQRWHKYKDGDMSKPLKSPADIWGWGCLMMELLMGGEHVPFFGLLADGMTSVPEDLIDRFLKVSHMIATMPLMLHLGHPYLLLR